MTENNEPKPPATDDVAQTLHAHRHRPDCQCRFCERIRANYRRSIEKRKLLRGRGWTAKNERFVQNYINSEGEGFGNATKSAELAGLSGSRGRQLIHGAETKRAIIGAMERKGITSDFLADRLREGLLAMETKFFSEKGRVVETRETVDHYARHRFTETVMRARGDLTAEPPTALAALIINLGDESLSEGEWEKRVAEIEVNQKLCPHCRTDHPPTYDCREN